MLHFFLSRLPRRWGSEFKITHPNETQAMLIKHLVAETKVREAFDGEVHGATTKFDSFVESLPHQAILTVLKFIGVPDLWLEFFTRFLKAPLHMGPVVHGASDQIHNRTHGVPVAHGMERLFSELSLFFLDISVHQKTDGYLYRLHDECYFIGNNGQCQIASEAIAKFSESFGLTHKTTDMSNTTIGAITLEVKEGESSISINNDKVDAHAYRVKKQLSACTGVLDWIRTWNSTIGTYASHLFGPLTNSIGRPHLDAITQAYNRIHDIIFDGNNLTVHLRLMLQPHLPSPTNTLLSTLDPLLYLPTPYGGLGIKNPYTALNLALDIPADPTTGLQTYLASEKEYYDHAKSVFASWEPSTLTTKLENMSLLSPERQKDVFGTLNPETTFFPITDMTKYREHLEYLPHLFSASPIPVPIPDYAPVPMALAAYEVLFMEPKVNVWCRGRVGEEVTRCAREDGMKNWWSMSAEERWVVKMFGEECVEKFGGLRMWVGRFVPRELVRVVRGMEGEESEEINPDDIL